MPELKCSVKNCYYNKSSKCCRKNIDIHGQDAIIVDGTYCNDFREKRDIVTAMEGQCEERPQKVPDVKCEAVNCIFQDNAKCHAEKITIDGMGAYHQSQTKCQSFECSRQ